MARGECNCGAVAFEIDADLDGVYVCHCSICRRATGSNGIVVVVFNKTDFRWTRGEDQVATWEKPEGHWQIWFCSVCGSPVPGENDEKRMFAPANTLTEGHEDLKVLHHFYVDSKAPWDEIGDQGEQHPASFGSGK